MLRAGTWTLPSWSDGCRLNLTSRERALTVHVRNCPLPSFDSCTAQGLLDMLDRDHDGRVAQDEFVRVFSRLKHIEDMTVNLLLQDLHWDEVAEADAKKNKASSEAGAGAARPGSTSSSTSAAADVVARRDIVAPAKVQHRTHSAGKTASPPDTAIAVAS